MDDSLLREIARRKKLRFDTSATPSGLVEGEVQKVVGVVRAAEEPWRAPFTGRECVAFTVRGLGGRDELVFRPSQMERTQSFWLEHDEGSVWVRPEAWVRYLIPAWRGDRSDPAAWVAFDDFSARYGMHLRETLGGFTDGLLFLERAVEVGARVAVVGEVGPPHFPTDARGGYRERRGAPSLAPPANGRLWISSYESHLE